MFQTFASPLKMKESHHLIPHSNAFFTPLWHRYALTGQQQGPRSNCQSAGMDASSLPCLSETFQTSAYLHGFLPWRQQSSTQSTEKEKVNLQYRCIHKYTCCSYKGDLQTFCQALLFMSFQPPYSYVLGMVETILNNEAWILLLWFEYKMSPTGSCVGDQIGPQLVGLLGGVETVGFGPCWRK
jgi:hypothetical protein